MASDQDGNHQQQKTIHGDAQCQRMSDIVRISSGEAQEDQGATQRINDRKEGRDHDRNGANQLGNNVHGWILGRAE